MLVLMIVTFIGVLLQPLTLVVGIATGILSRTWWLTVVGGLVAGAIAFATYDLPLTGMRTFVLCILAGLLTAGATFGVKQQLAAGR